LAINQSDGIQIGTNRRNEDIASFDDFSCAAWSVFAEHSLWFNYLFRDAINRTNVDIGDFFFLAWNALNWINGDR
jgi:hypothetical protein